MPKSILVTGASGFIGQHLVRELRQYYQIILQMRKKSRETTRIKTFTLDFSRTLNLNKLDTEVGKIVHLAGEFEKKKDFKRLYFANTYSTYLLTNWAVEHGIGEFVLASTGGVYGLGRHREDDPTNPLDLYALTKRQAEEILLWSPIKKAKIGRIFFCYGPGAKRGLIYNLFQKVIKGEEITVDRLVINPIYIDDLIEYLKRMLRSTEGGIFNLAGPEEILLSDLVDMLGKIAGKRVWMKRGVNKGELVGLAIKAKRELNYKPHVDLGTGLERTYESLVSDNR